MTVKFIFLFLIFVISNISHAGQDSTALAGDSVLVSDTAVVIDSVRSYRLNIRSNLENARIFFDTVYIGLTPLKDYNVKEGIYKIRIVNPKSLKDWKNANQDMETTISNDTTITADFQYYYYFNTNPFDVKVFLKDSLLGITPLRFFRDNELTGSLIFRKKNYRDFTFDLNKYDFESGANINLTSKGKEEINDIVYVNRGTQFATKRSLLPIAFLGAASIAATYFAFSFKSTANTEYDKYLLNGNSYNLDKSNQNDTYFIISIALMQAAIGGLIYFLFFAK